MKAAAYWKVDPEDGRGYRQDILTAGGQGELFAPVVEAPNQPEEDLAGLIADEFANREFTIEDAELFALTNTGFRETHVRKLALEPLEAAGRLSVDRRGRRGFPAGTKMRLKPSVDSLRRREPPLSLHGLGQVIPGTRHRVRVHRLLLVRPPHCLKKYATSCVVTALAKLASPLGLHRRCFGPTLAARDEPVDARQVEPFERTEQRLGRDEPHRRRNAPQRRRRGARSDGSRSSTPIQTFIGHAASGASSASRSWRLVRIWNTCRSARRITSNTSAMYSSGMSSWKRSLIELTKIVRGRPIAVASSRSGQSLRSNPCSYGCPGDAAPALGERLRVAMGAARRDLVAARDRVPRRLGPLDLAAVRHLAHLSSRWTLLICPSCERMFAAGSDGSACDAALVRMLAPSSCLTRGRG